MTTTTPTSKLKTAVPSQTLTSNNVQMAAALILGVVVLVGVGFAPRLPAEILISDSSPVLATSKSPDFLCRNCMPKPM